jgi:hypothetical protein
MFRRNILPPSSGPKIKPNKNWQKQAVSRAGCGVTTRKTVFFKKHIIMLRGYFSFRRVLYQVVSYAGTSVTEEQMDDICSSEA